MHGNENNCMRERLYDNHTKHMREACTYMSQMVLELLATGGGGVSERVSIEY